MEIYLIVAVVMAGVMALLGYFMGNRGKKELEENVTRLTAERDVLRANAENAVRQVEVQKTFFEHQITAQKESHEQQIAALKEAHEQQIAALKQMTEEQVKSQLELIREQMQTTSEKVLKQRQDELGERNREQVSKIIDPLQKSLKDMQEALDKTKEQQTEALTRLDETIKINMQKSMAIGETADRLTRALTGEVKVQGNFGELKLKQLLEDLELREGKA